MERVLEKAAELIKQFEGCRLKSYKDQAGKWTVGYGATGSFITGQTLWTQEQADKDLSLRIEALYSILRKRIMPPLKDNQWAALISLAYNIGVTALFGSLLIRLLNERDMDGAAKQFLVWSHVNHQTNQGLLNRRTAEMEIFTQ